MIIKDVKGLYELKVDLNRNVVFEKNSGAWVADDFIRYHNEYIIKIVPMFKGKKWSKCSDLRQYRVSSITDEINKHMVWCMENNFAGGAIIVESAVVKMQMNRSSKELGVIPIAFDNLEEADKWLKSQGF